MFMYLICTGFDVDVPADDGAGDVGHPTPVHGGVHVLPVVLCSERGKVEGAVAQWLSVTESKFVYQW